MKKAIIISGMMLSAVIATQSVYAVAGNDADRAAARDDKKADREAMISEKKIKIADKKSEKVCERISKRIESMGKKTADREQLAQGKITQRLTQVQQKRTIGHEELLARREMRDTQRQAFYDKLLMKAITDEQKTAVQQFETTIEEAVTIRRAAIDNATKKMQTDVDALTTKKQDEIDQLFADYKTAENAAIVKAKGACTDTSSETDLKSIAKTLNDDLKTARETFRSGVRDTRTMGSEIHVLTQRKKEAAQNAIDAFKVTMLKARVELQNAFGSITNVDGEMEIGE